MAWDMTDRQVTVGPGAFSEIVSAPSGNAVTGGGYALLNPDGSTGKPIANVWRNAPNESGSWIVSGNLDQACKLVLYVISS